MTAIINPTPRDLAESLGLSADAIRKQFDRLNLGSFSAREPISEPALTALKSAYLNSKDTTIRERAKAVFGENVADPPNVAPSLTPTKPKRIMTPQPAPVETEQPRPTTPTVKLIAAGLCVTMMLTFSFFSIAHVFCSFSEAVTGYSLAFIFSVSVLYYTVTGVKKMAWLLAGLIAVVHGAYFGIWWGGAIWSHDAGTIMSAFVATFVVPILDVSFSDTFSKLLKND